MSSTRFAAGGGQQFHGLYRRLSRHQANALLNDCIYELPAAWKFLTALRSDLPALIVLHGFSGVPFAFARHLQRVDIWGFNENEAELFLELAQFKKLSNCRLCFDTQELRGPYGLILWLPTRSAVDNYHEDEWLMQIIMHLHPQGELWLTHCYKPDWSSPLSRMRRLLRRLKSREHESLPTKIRLLPLSEPIPNQAMLEVMTAKLAARKNRPSPLRKLEHLGITPHWSAPIMIAPLPALAVRDENFFGNEHSLRALEQKKLLETYHALARFGRKPSPSFVLRLLRELARQEPESSFQPNHYRVLAGGKVQIDARWKKRFGEQGVFIKLPLVPFAEARLRKQSEMLNDLHRRDSRRRQNAPNQPTARKIFPQILAQGEFEKQAYFLESRVKGAPLSRLRVPNDVFPKVCEALFRFWHDVQYHHGEMVKITPDQFAPLFRQPLLNLAAWTQQTQQYDDIMRRLEDFFAEQFIGKEIFLGLVHGDFSTKNILTNPKNFELSGIIDWDIAARRSLPMLDVLHFFVRLDASSFQEAPPKIALRLIQSDARAFHRPYFQRGMQKFGYDEALLPAAAAFYWMQRLQVYLDSPKNLDAQFMQRHVYDILDFFAETLLKK